MDFLPRWQNRLQDQKGFIACTFFSGGGPENSVKQNPINNNPIIAVMLTTPSVVSYLLAWRCATAVIYIRDGCRTREVRHPSSEKN